MSNSKVEDIENIGFKGLYGTQHLKFKSGVDYDDKVLNFTNDLIDYILNNYENIVKKDVDRKMMELCKNYVLPKRPRYFVINYIIKTKIDEGVIDEDQYNILNSFMIAKVLRSASGILELAIMTSGEDFSCEFDCHYCPKIKGMPRSYVPDGPSARRALSWNFNTIGQFHERASVYALNGHPVDKIEIIVLGGTWDSYPIEYQRKFVRDVYRAANTFYEVGTDPNERTFTMEEEIKINETALCKIIGFTIETRPDQVSKEQIMRLLTYGVTRVQIGVQHTDNRILKKINRQCPIEKSYEAIYLLKEAGIKVLTHWMPNLPTATPQKDKEMFKEVNFNHLLKSDDIKIYPTIVTKTGERDNEEVYTEIEKWYRDGKYVPYSNQLLNEVVIEAKEDVDESTRISRVFRDIPMGNILGGANVPNMREVLGKIMAEEGKYCRCIRCCEVKERLVDRKDIRLRVREHKSSHAKEYFISMVSYKDNIEIDKNRIIHGFVRLRIPITKSRPLGEWLHELDECALIREVHVYGKLNPTFYRKIKGNKGNQYQQHKGLGREMIDCAEKLAIENGFNRISITSGVGVRKYYEKIGYKLGEYYMIKDLTNKYYKEMLYSIIFYIGLLITMIILYFIMCEVL